MIKVTSSQEFEIPFMDIYTQEYFFQLFAQMITHSKKSWADSDSVHTYLPMTLVEKIVQKFVKPLYTESHAVDRMERLDLEFQRLSSKLAKPGFLDLDSCLSLLLEEFRYSKRQIQKDLKKHFFDVQLWTDDRTELTPINLIETLDRFKAWPRFQRLGQFITMPRTITRLRALISIYMSGENTGKVSAEQFINGCTRFALDNPVPTIT
jgi:hypothetical protein